MAIISYYYLRARVQAQFHVQVEIESLHIYLTPTEAPVRARVQRVFRGNELVQVGDHLNFGIDICSAGDDIPCSGRLWIRREDAEAARFMEVFLDGEPPDLEVPYSQVFIIDSLSEIPHIKVPSEQELEDSAPREKQPGLLQRLISWLFKKRN